MSGNARVKPVKATISERVIHKLGENDIQGFLKQFEPDEISNVKQPSAFTEDLLKMPRSRSPRSGAPVRPRRSSRPPPSRSLDRKAEKRRNWNEQKRVRWAGQTDRNLTNTHRSGLVAAGAASLRLFRPSRRQSGVTRLRSRQWTLRRCGAKDES